MHPFSLALLCISLLLHTIRLFLHSPHDDAVYEIFLKKRVDRKDGYHRYDDGDHPRENGMLISTMFYQDDIKDLQKSYKIPEPTEQELKMAEVLINSMDMPFDPAQYKDEYQGKLKELIETKISEKKLLRQSRSRAAM